MQTLLASLARRPHVERRAAALIADSRSVLLPCSDGVTLQAWINEPRGSSTPGRGPWAPHAAAPGAIASRTEPEATTKTTADPATVVLIHGWLGSADSSYLLSAAAELLAAGFRVARLNLRDHGGTEHLNEGLFHSARTQEVVDAVRQLAGKNGGIIGFSLGGNFALRVTRALGIPALAVCPAIAPPETMIAIDNGWIGYRWYFVRKWHAALRAKERAFPDRYDFSRAYPLQSVSALTDLFVRYHTDYPDTASYLAAYALTGDALHNTRATVIAAADDPIIPQADFEQLPESIDVQLLPWGGHCGFVEGIREPAWIDRYAVTFFRNALA